MIGLVGFVVALVAFAVDDVALDAVACITSCSVVFFNAMVSGTGILRAVADSVVA